MPAGAQYRNGVPPARHAHVLLMRGQLILERFFPGICHDLVAAGGIEFDATRNLAWLTPAGWGARFTSGLLAVSTTRSLLEWTVRRRLRRQPEVEFRDGFAVLGLVRAADRPAVAAVRLHGRTPI